MWAGTSFEATPLVVDDTLYIATSFNRIIALDPETGREKWAFNPKLDRIGYYGDYFTCRGLATWVDPESQPSQACHRTVFEAMLDGRLVAVDGATGQPCAAFGNHGQVSLTTGIKTEIKGEYHFTSPPAVVGSVVVVGSAINDNNRVDMPSGVVRAWTATSRGPMAT